MCDFHYQLAVLRSSREACLLGIMATVLSRGNVPEAGHSGCPDSSHFGAHHLANACVSGLTSCEPRAKLFASLGQ